MGTWVLIVLVMGIGNSYVPALVTQEFTSQERCETAAKVIREKVGFGAFMSSQRQFVQCFEK